MARRRLSRTHVDNHAVGACATEGARVRSVAWPDRTHPAEWRPTNEIEIADEVEELVPGGLVGREWAT
jgi:hypothetical protein